MKENSSKKAWTVPLERIEEGYMYVEQVVYADKRSEAKKNFYIYTLGLVLVVLVQS